MADIRSLTDAEIAKYITLIEQEIDLCLECDLSIRHLEAEMSTLHEVIRQRHEAAYAEYAPFGGGINATAPALVAVR